MPADAIARVAENRAMLVAPAHKWVIATIFPVAALEQGACLPRASTLAIASLTLFLAPAPPRWANSRFHRSPWPIRRSSRRI